MKNKPLVFVWIMIVCVVSCSCSSSQIAPTQTNSEIESTPIIPLKPTLVDQPAPTITPLPQGKTIIVNSKSNDGEGTLRQVLQYAQSGDTIVFDSDIFPPDSPAIITLNSGLPSIHQGYITIDASEAGVILDGMGIDEWTAAFEIQSQNNIIRGIHIQNFPGAGFMISPGADGNIIGGDLETGTAQFGQGNVIVNCSDGLIIQSNGNMITGNLIGTDGSELTDGGNFYPGIAFELNASNNIIGPKNIIAYNGKESGAGIEIRSKSSINNQITENLVFENKFGSISYIDSAADMENATSIPIIFEFNLEEGYLNGFACPGCVIEVFSTGEGEDEIFEIRIEVDKTGYFEVNKEGGFKGPSLTANAFESGKNTSPLGGFTTGEFNNLEIQSSNTNNLEILTLLNGKEIRENHLGEMHYIGVKEGEDFTDYANRAKNLGYTWIRVSLDWYDWDEIAVTDEYSNFGFSGSQENAIDFLYSEGIDIYYTIVYWDDQIQTFSGYRRFQREEEIERYLEYTKFIVEKFKGKIKWYSILNESNCFDGQRAVRSQEYIELAKRVIPLIKEIDPESKVVLGEVSPFFDCNSFDYLKDIVTSDAIALADGIAWHGSSGLSMEYNSKAYMEYSSQVSTIVEEAYVHGFRGEFFANEIGFRTDETPDPFGYNEYYYSPTVAAKYYLRSIVFHQGKGYMTNIGLEDYTSISKIKNSVTSLSTILTGTEPISIQTTIDPQIENIYQFGFKNSAGHYLLAVWADQPAIDSDPSIPVTIKIDEMNIESITAIDPLYQYRQKLELENEGEQVAIKNFLLKDYPIFLDISLE